MKNHIFNSSVVFNGKKYVSPLYMAEYVVYFAIRFILALVSVLSDSACAKFERFEQNHKYVCGTVYMGLFGYVAFTMLDHFLR